MKRKSYCTPEFKIKSSFLDPVLDSTPTEDDFFGIENPWDI